MNDWLDYKGSGSSRSYIAHGIFGIQTKKEREDKQREANKRYADERSTYKEKYDKEYQKAKKEYEDSIDDYNRALKDYERYSNELNQLNKDRERVAVKSPLTAAQMYERRIKIAKDNKDDAENRVTICKNRMRELKSKFNDAAYKLNNAELYQITADSKYLNK